MQESLLEKITVERGLIFILIFAVLIVFAFIFYLFFSQFTKKIEVLTPNGGEEWEMSKTYEVTWKARGVARVGIVLFKGKEPKWIGRNIDANLGKYEWKIYPGQEYGDDYWVAVFEYPWQKGNEIDHSDSSFAVVYPELATCESLSVENEWPYLPNDLPDARRIFITQTNFTGDLEGLDGADQKCQAEAENNGFEGIWQAFLGGDSDEETALARLNQTPRKTDGIFIAAQSAETLIRGATCHRLVAKNIEELVAIFSELWAVNAEKFDDEVSENLDDIWLGRIDKGSKKNCISVDVGPDVLVIPEKYSFTATCQNWTKGNRTVEGYPPGAGLKPSFPTCYTPQGQLIDAVALLGLSSGLTGEGNDKTFTGSQGKYCNSRQRLICIEE